MKWTPEEETLLISNLGEKSFDEIAALIEAKHNSNLPGFPTTRTIPAIRRKVQRDSLIDRSSNPYDDTWRRIVDISKEYRSKSAHHDIGLSTSKARKIITFSDLHVPFFLWEDMQRALAEHSDADVVVLNGDILDAYIFSTFSKSKRIAALKEYM